VGDSACPFTTLYWDYLLRHEKALKKNQRMSLQVRNLGRLSEERKSAIREQAERIRKNPGLVGAGRIRWNGSSSASLDLPVSPAAAFAWHERPGALERLNPPWEPVEVLSHPGHLRDGAEVELAVRVGPWRQELAFRHEGYRPGVEFRDRQVRGPFAQVGCTVTNSLRGPAAGAGWSTGLSIACPSAGWATRWPIP
jgi:hypothetical protein